MNLVPVTAHDARDDHDVHGAHDADEVAYSAAVAADDLQVVANVPPAAEDSSLAVEDEAPAAEDDPPAERDLPDHPINSPLN